MSLGPSVLKSRKAACINLWCPWLLQGSVHQQGAVDDEALDLSINSTRMADQLVIKPNLFFIAANGPFTVLAVVSHMQGHLGVCCCNLYALFVSVLF